MNLKKVLLLFGASAVFLFSSLISWYEGGQLRDISWEWKHTAIFSNWLNGEVTSSNEILEIDHFVYAAKFEPLFPLLMAASLLFVVFQVALWAMKDRKTIRNMFFLGMAVLSFVLSGLFFNSPTTGLLLFSIFFGGVGIFSLLGIFLVKNQEIKTANNHSSASLHESHYL